MIDQLIKPNKGSNKGKMRVGRGNASGKGGECGRGHKGAKARAGYKSKPGFEGGQTPLYRRLPKKRGFLNMNRVEYNVVNVGQLNDVIAKAGNTITIDVLYDTLKLNCYQPIKILGNGEISQAFTIASHKFSESARVKLTKAGCTITQLEG